MKLKPGMYVLMMNDMRAPQVEMLTPVLCADTVEEIAAYLETQREAAIYTDGKWGKLFKRGSPLEWFNDDNRTAEELVNPPFGTRVYRVVIPGGNVPSIAELVAE